MVSENGNLNGDGHAQLRDEASYRARGGWQTLMRAVNRGETVAEEQYRKNVQLAVEMRDDPRRADRVRQRAAEFLNAMIEKGVDIAMYIDKTERIDSGQATERVVHEQTTYRLEFDRAG